MANQALQLYECLKGRGGEVILVRTNDPYRPDIVRHIKGIRALFRLIPYLFQLWNVAGRVEVMHVLANSGWSWHLFAAPAVWIARLRNTPVIVNYRGGEAESFFHSSWRVVEPTLNKASLIVVPSGFLEAVFAKWNIEAKVIPNILDLERFDASRQKDMSHNNVTRIVVTRNLEAIYDVATVIRAFAIINQQVANARLIIAGSGPEMDALKFLVSELELEGTVEFTGRISNVQIAELYKDANLMLNASLVDNSPNALIEAMASGVPVVSSNVGGIPYLVEDGKSGLLVPAKSPEVLARAAIRVLNDDVLRESLVDQGRKVAKRFDKNSVLQMLENEYRTLAGRSA